MAIAPLPVPPQAPRTPMKGSLIQTTLSRLFTSNLDPYSNTGYALLALIVDRAARDPLDQFAGARIFSPLNMNDSGSAAYSRCPLVAPESRYGVDARCATRRNRTGAKRNHGDTGCGHEHDEGVVSRHVE
jgi:CubicO group peptidase (beta-lactamase class C family)